MTKPILPKILFFLQFSLLSTPILHAQCTTANVNWDNLDYLVTTGKYAGFVTTAMALTQNFAIGTNRLTIAVANGGITLNGESSIHTGETGSYGTGADVSFATTVAQAKTITLTFNAEVSAFKLSLYDLDRSQKVKVTAKNAANVSKTVSLSKPSGGSIVLAGNPGNSPSGTGSSSNSSNSSITGTLNIDIAGPVKTIVLSFSNAAGDFWLSDISACVTGEFPNSYYLIAKAFTGQPGYVLTSMDNNVYYTNTANGVSNLLFTDPAATNVNSMAYDPYKGYVYYTYSLTGSSQTDKALKKYDVNTGTMSTILADINTLGIPTFEKGIESGGAAFYNDQLFLGIEGYADDFKGGRKSIIWRVDFTGTVPTSATQVYASVADDGNGNILHDWSDFGISNGILYDFDGATGDMDFYKFNMQTGGLTNYNPAPGVTPRQVAIGWDEKIYDVDGTIALYNGSNSTGTAYTITSTPPIPGGGSWGDAGEAFRPFVDFGDAPSTYDNAAGDPAVHDLSNTTLRIGPAVSIEGVKRGTTSVEDSYDDGLSYVPILSPTAGNYLAQVSVYNNTGSDATLCAWLDYSGDNIFNTSEGITITVISNASPQLKYLYWPSISTPLSNGSYTYLRIRITSASNGMTTAYSTGYYSNGEVEDYKVTVDHYPLSVSMLSFDARVVNNNKVKLNWSANEERSFNAYKVERSNNGTDWEHIAFVYASHSPGTRNYELMDEFSGKGTFYYRLKLGEYNGVSKYSAIRIANIKDFSEFVRILPNPASDYATVNIFSTYPQSSAIVKVLGINGNELYLQKAIIRLGDNPVNLPIPGSWPSGMYIVQIDSNGQLANKKLLIAR